MHAVVTKNPDGVSYITQDAHGVVWEGDLVADDPARPLGVGDCTIRLVLDSHPFAPAGQLLVQFSYVDYLDTSNRGVPSQGVRSTIERAAPVTFAAGPYVVQCAEALTGTT